MAPPPPSPSRPLPIGKLIPAIALDALGAGALVAGILVRGREGAGALSGILIGTGIACMVAAAGLIVRAVLAHRSAAANG